MPRCLHLSSLVVPSWIAAFALAACGPAPVPHTEALDGSTPTPGDPGGELVVAVPEPTATAAPNEPPPAGDTKIPSRPVTVTSGVEPCIATMRNAPGDMDPSKALGLAEYQDGLAAERTGKLDVARKDFFQVIQKYPQSSLIPGAYFAFGEMFANEAKSDPSKVALAEQSYLEVIKYPSGPGSLRSVGNYRLGLVLRGSKAQQSLSNFAKAAKADREAPTDACAAEVAAAAVSASTEVFAAVGAPDKCWGFYLGLTGDGARTAAACVAVSEKLAAGNNGSDAAKALAATIELGVKAQPDDAARAAYCKRAQAAADGARSKGVGSASLDKAIAAVCR